MTYRHKHYAVEEPWSDHQRPSSRWKKDLNWLVLLRWDNLLFEEASILIWGRLVCCVSEGIPEQPLPRRGIPRRGQHCSWWLEVCHTCRKIRICLSGSPCHRAPHTWTDDCTWKTNFVLDRCNSILKLHLLLTIVLPTHFSNCFQMILTQELRWLLCFFFPSDQEFTTASKVHFWTRSDLLFYLQQ